MRHLYSFEKLEVWQKSKELSLSIYQITSLFPQSEKYGLTNQMRRCSISISSNIAEGSSRGSLKDQSRFYNIAHGSLMELLSQAIISLELKLLNENDYLDLRTKINSISKLLSGLRNSTFRKIPKL